MHVNYKLIGWLPTWNSTGSSSHHKQFPLVWQSDLTSVDGGRLHGGAAEQTRRRPVREAAGSSGRMLHSDLGAVAREASETVGSAGECDDPGPTLILGWHRCRWCWWEVEQGCDLLGQSTNGQQDSSVTNERSWQNGRLGKWEAFDNTNLATV